MSHFQRPNTTFAPNITTRGDFSAVDRRLCPDARMRSRPWEDGLLWPRPRLVGTEAALGMLSQNGENTGRWGIERADESGGATMLKITGYTRAFDGTGLPGVTVQGFLTASDSYIRDCASDLVGFYEFYSQYAGAGHYMVAYRVGSPDVFGTTVNTLVPT